MNKKLRLPFATAIDFGIIKLQKSTGIKEILGTSLVEEFVSSSISSDVSLSPNSSGYIPSTESIYSGGSNNDFSSLFPGRRESCIDLLNKRSKERSR